MRDDDPNQTPVPNRPPALREELRTLLNRYSQENASNTPDYILASYLIDSLDAFDRATSERERWHGRADQDGRHGIMGNTGIVGHGG